MKHQSKLVLLALFALVATSAARAEELTPSVALKDIGLYFTSPVRWDSRDWTVFAGSLATIAVAHHYDDNVRHHFTADSPQSLGGGDPHGSNDWVPTTVVLAGTWVYAALLRDRAGFAEGWSMLEAAGLSATSGYIFKSIVGRERPNETTDPNSWFAHGDSFPSSHTTVAFAVGTVLAESGSENYRWVRRFLGYGMAGATAYLRMKHNEHWLSDNVAGAWLGLETAGFVLGRRAQVSSLAALSVVPMNDGVMLTYSVALH